MADCLLRNGGFTKKQLLTLLGLGLLLTTVWAYAQTIKLKANVPFNFVVTEERLPGGEYTIRSEKTDPEHQFTIAGRWRK